MGAPVAAKLSPNPISHLKDKSVRFRDQLHKKKTGKIPGTDEHVNRLWRSLYYRPDYHKAGAQDNARSSSHEISQVRCEWERTKGSNVLIADELRSCTFCSVWHKPEWHPEVQADMTTQCVRRVSKWVYCLTYGTATRMVECCLPLRERLQTIWYRMVHLEFRGRNLEQHLLTMLPESKTVISIW